MEYQRMWQMKILYTNLMPDWILRPVFRATTGHKVRQLERLPQAHSETAAGCCWRSLTIARSSPVPICPISSIMKSLRSFSSWCWVNA